MDQAEYAALIQAAIVARDRAYAPYSRFQVGAAVLSASGRIFHGCNIENAAYPMTICAERAAIFSAYSGGEREIKALAVVTATEEVASPCGACRQVIFELAPKAEVILLNLQGRRRLTTPQLLLPAGFGPAQLEEGRDGAVGR